ncbi:hypothetical protein BIT28_08900 [Photobacterium proteolyticum]|uniref:SbsA Ig-like domain-containing protein n=1 Tax=Photobacterium proteolyticum TaxID=1903952 RepID=A0A1Q9GIK3_9GAMM|nr:hypothetical protein [Photobacterium proteolyticum]OLQ74287.1 hypothetical protein BIT28_08900 [Photobacterium proteolyticum]
MRVAYLFSLAIGLSICSSTAIASTCEPAAEKAHVSAVYPTADRLPENLLRFYVYFSKPMQREDILSSVYLEDKEGKRLQGVFLDNKFSLWSIDSSRLTLLFDPGRVKTGLVAHNAMGRALIPGEDYQLVINTTAVDTEGCQLEQEYRKPFKAVEADYEVPDVDKWIIHNPNMGSSEALAIELNGKMDHVSLAYRIRVKDKKGQTVAGSIELSEHEKMWLFYPDIAWDKKQYQLFIDPILEDVAGNRLSGLFDQPSLAAESAAQKQWISIPIILEK